MEQDQPDDSPEQQVEDEQFLPVAAEGVEALREIGEQEAAFQQDEERDEEAGDEGQTLLRASGWRSHTWWAKARALAPPQLIRCTAMGTVSSSSISAITTVRPVKRPPAPTMSAV